MKHLSGTLTVITIPANHIALIVVVAGNATTPHQNHGNRHRRQHGMATCIDAAFAATRIANTAAARYTVLFEDGDKFDLSLDELKCAERMSLLECC